MNLQYIDIENLKVSKLNARKIGGKAVDDLVSSIRALGVLQPLLVRPVGVENEGGFEIVAGQRRYHACLKIAAEDGGVDPLPCAIMEQGDDARAIEASLAENIARLPMDEIDQHKAFAALVKKGGTVADIAADFGVTERLVKQRLAIANLIGPLLAAYRKGDIHPETLRLLTMATKTQQRDWLALFRGDEDHAPEGYRLKCWLFGGAEIPVSAALFDVDGYEGGIVSDLFGEERYFADAEDFWKCQSAAIAEAKARYLEEGWAEVVVLDIGAYFQSWEHVDTAKEDGGKVYIAPARNGEVTFYEGQLSRSEARKRIKAAEDGDAPNPERPELTKVMQRYLDLHRHAAVRTALLDHAGLALRLAVAQIIAGSALWSVDPEPCRPPSEAVADSLAANGAQARFAEERAAMREFLGLEGEADDPVVHRSSGWGSRPDASAILTRLIAMEDETVLRILAFVTAETLPCGPELVEPLGAHLGVDMRACWNPDETFFELLRDKAAINAMLAEIAGERVAAGNLTATAKVQKQIIRDCQTGTRKAKVDNWLPRYMRFPMQGYTGRGGVPAIEAGQRLEAEHPEGDAPEAERREAA